jgi:hypothetical protein
MLYTFNGDAHFHHIAIFGCNCLFFVGELVSWLTSLLLRLPIKQQLAETHSTTKLGRGTATQSTAEASDLETTFSSKTCQEPTEFKSSEVSPWLRVKGD